MGGHPRECAQLRRGGRWGGGSGECVTSVLKLISDHRSENPSREDNRALKVTMTTHTGCHDAPSQRSTLVSLSLWQPLTFKKCALMLMTSGSAVHREQVQQLILLEMRLPETRRTRDLGCLMQPPAPLIYLKYVGVDMLQDLLFCVKSCYMIIRCIVVLWSSPSDEASHISLIM